MTHQENHQQEHIGKYRLDRLLGQGGEGCVYLAQDLSLNRPAALKKVGEDNPAAEEQLKKEAAFLQKLRHPMLPVVYDLLWDGAWYLAMEYIPGMSLHNYIKRNGKVQETQAKLWADQLLDFLQYLHTGTPPVIYQDLKPDNIMVCPDGSLRLVDFGAAFFQDYAGGTAAEKTEAGKAVSGKTAAGRTAVRRAASIGYAAPEQIPRQGRETAADERSDLYAFGKVMYYVLTGADPAYPPYARLPIASYAPEVGSSLAWVIDRCMEEDPGRRYQVAEDVREALHHDRRGIRGALCHDRRRIRGALCHDRRRIKGALCRDRRGIRGALCRDRRGIRGALHPDGRESGEALRIHGRSRKAAGLGRRSRGRSRKSGIRIVEKRLLLTEKKSAGLMAL